MCMVKKEFLACSSSAIKQVCLPVWEAAFFMFVSGVLVGESASLYFQSRLPVVDQGVFSRHSVSA